MYFLYTGCSLFYSASVHFSLINLPQSFPKYPFPSAFKLLLCFSWGTDFHFHITKLFHLCFLWQTCIPCSRHIIVTTFLPAFAHLNNCLSINSSLNTILPRNRNSFPWFNYLPFLYNLQSPIPFSLLATSILDLSTLILKFMFFVTSYNKTFIGKYEGSHPSIT